MMMTKSIWDVRFTNHGVAQDADDDDQQWITVRGARVLIDGDGTVVGGAGGKFNGQSFAKTGQKTSEEKEKAQNKKKLNDLESRSKYVGTRNFKYMHESGIKAELKELGHLSSEAFEMQHDESNDQETRDAASKLEDKLFEREMKAFDELDARQYKKESEETFHNHQWDLDKDVKARVDKLKNDIKTRARDGSRMQEEMKADYKRWRGWMKERKRILREEV